VSIVKEAEGNHIPGFSNTVGPPNEPSNILIGVNTNRGPISTSDVCGGPDGFSGSFSTIWKLRNQILLSSREKVRMWSMNGFSFRDVFGTEKVCGGLCQYRRIVVQGKRYPHA
jgi:hypothetical protein